MNPFCFSGGMMRLFSRSHASETMSWAHHRLGSDDQAGFGLMDISFIGAESGEDFVCGGKHQPLLLEQGLSGVGFGRLFMKGGGIPMVFQPRVGAPVTHRRLQSQRAAGQDMPGAAGHQDDVIDLLEDARHHQTALPVGAGRHRVFVKGVPSGLLKKMEFRPGRQARLCHAGRSPSDGANSRKAHPGKV